MWGLEQEEYNVIKDIEYVKSLYDLQKVKVKNEKYIEELLLQDYVRTIRRNISRYEYVDFKTAQNELKEKAKSKRKNIEMLRNMMSDDFLNDDDNFKIIGIMACGYEDYAWAIEIEGYGVTFRIDIPMMKNLTTSNIGYANNGMFAFIVKEGNSCWSVLERSYNTKDIANYIKEYFNLDKLNDE